MCMITIVVIFYTIRDPKINQLQFSHPQQYNSNKNRYITLCPDGGN